MLPMHSRSLPGCGQSTSEATPGQWRLARALGLALVACLPLAGCGGGSMADLRDYVAEVKKRKGSAIEELPPIEPYVVYTYQSSDSTDPFAPFFQPPDEEAGPKVACEECPQPDFDRNREELEGHALDSLRMMGTLEKDDDIWGIVRSPDAIIHRVKVGNYMGKNHGKIINISEEKIELVEIVPDGQGGWIERDAALALVE